MSSKRTGTASPFEAVGAAAAFSAPAVPDNTLSGRIAAIHGALAVSTTRFFAGYGLTLREGRLLLFFGAQPPRSAKDTSERLGMDKAGVSRAINGLEAGGYVRRTPDLAVPRSWLVELTPMGRRLYARIERAYELRSEALLAPLTPAERVAFFDVLDRLDRHLAEIDAAQPAAPIAAE